MNLLSRPLLFFSALVLATTPTWIWYGKRIVDGSDEPWGIVALLGAAFVLWSRRRTLFPPDTTIYLPLLGLVCYAIGSLFLPPLLLAAIAIAVLATALGQAGRSPGLLALLVLSLPIEASLQFYAGYPLRRIATELSAFLLQLTGLPIQAEGTQLLDAESVVSVAPACAGIQMLWLSLALTAFFTALSRSSWLRSGSLLLATVLLVIATNSLRITALFFKENGRFDLPEWTHEGIGLLAFALLIPLLIRITNRNETFRPSSEKRLTKRRFPTLTPIQRILVLLIITATALCPLLGKRAQEPDLSKTPDWPKKLNGEWLEPVPLSEFELAFARDFPGHIAAFRAGESRVILRQVLRPTRKLHPSQDCFRASGFSISGDHSGSYQITKESYHFHVIEAIHESNLNEPARWHHPSDWYWEAVFAKTRAPWLAITVVSPMKKILPTP